MLNTKKLLYILPDSTYIAEILPAKKPNTFAIQAFRQINGNFIDENEFIAENIEKLFKKIDADEYHLILPDFLFTNTIVDVNETTDTGVKKYLIEKLLPSLELSKSTHELDTFILTQHQNKSKVQLSALEKSLLAPIQQGAEAQQVKITAVSPLSWTIKSVISLEPSLSTIQIGEMLYLAQHYIGIDQTISFSIHETDNIVETVKTLKGAEPNIQTMYLLTNQLVENEIKEKLSGTLPIQQLSNFADEQEGIPSYVKQIIEAGGKTLSIPEYPVPQFALGKFAGVVAPVTKQSEEIVENKEPEKVDAVMPAAKSASELPAPSLPSASVATTQASPSLVSPVEPRETTSVAPSKIELNDSDEAAAPKLVSSQVESLHEDIKAPMVKQIIQKIDLPDDSQKKSELVAASVPVAPSISEVVSAPIASVLPVAPAVVAASIVSPVASPSLTSSVASVVQPITPVTVPPVSANLTAAPSLSQSTPVINPAITPLSNSTLSGTGQMTKTPPTTNPVSPTVPSSRPTSPFQTTPPGASASRPVIKNKTGNAHLYRMIAITFAALVTTVAVGVGIGFTVLKVSEQNSPLKQNIVIETSPAPVVKASPLPSPSVAPSISATELKTKKILVINATDVAGKAGKIKSLLTTAGYKTVETANAKGTYKEGANYLLMKASDPSILQALEKDTKLTLTYQADKSVEDAKEVYEAVIVIGEK